MRKKNQRLSGTTGLIASVIFQARVDALRGEPLHKTDALRYLRSETYQGHLRMLDLPEDFLPQD